MYENDKKSDFPNGTSDNGSSGDGYAAPSESKGGELFEKGWQTASRPFTEKFIFKVKPKAPAPIPEEHVTSDSLLVSVVESASSSEDMSNSASSPTESSQLSVRMENGDPMPRLAPGIYHRKPTPILSVDGPAPFAKDSLKVPLPVKTPEVPCSTTMRGPPPNWMPPQPPEAGQRISLPPEEDTYEDPEMINGEKDFSSHDRLLHPYNSYEVSVSQQRRSQCRENAPQLEGSPRVLHKNADGAYYIPTGSVRTQSSTLSPASPIRYDTECSIPVCSSARNSRVDPSTAILHQHSGNKIRNKFSPTNMLYEKSSKEDESNRRRPNILTLCLLFALLIALLVIILLLLRSPSYVYSEGLPGSDGKHFSEHLADLRPLPAAIHLGHRVYADLTPHSFNNAEIYIPRSSRVSLNVTVGTGAQLVLLARHSVPPSLSLHDVFSPIRADLVPVQAPTHTVEMVRRLKREAIEIVSPRSIVVEHFMLEGRWHLAILNERNRVEPIALLVQAVESNTDDEHSDNASREFLKCENDCSNHGECLRGVCKCATGYTGSTCEEAICPIVCSGNGVFSAGQCVCFEGFKGKECDVKQHWCEVADCNGRGRCSARGVCECQSGWSGDSCEIRTCSHPTCSNHGVCVDGKCYCEDGFRGVDCAMKIEEHAMIVHETPFESIPPFQSGSSMTPTAPSPSPRHPPRMKGRDAHDNKIDDPQYLPPEPSVSGTRPPSPTQTSPRQCNGRGHKDKTTGKCKCARGFEGSECESLACSPSCVHGVCQNGECRCEMGWKGAACEEIPCAFGCESHGRCEQNGTCLCDQGWNGENCYIEGCPRDCSSHGQCRVSGGRWSCVCDAAHKGDDCSIPSETSCDDGIDNDNDGLVDCEDPECCARAECRADPSCVTVPSPTDVLLTLPSPGNAEFFQRVMFLIKNDSVQSYADHGQFNESVVSVVRGRVVWDGGVTSMAPDQPLSGVRVSDVDHPLYGFTLSRLEGNGAFDLLVNGGRAVRLQFLRNPFQRKTMSIYVPPNQIVYVGDVSMSKDKSPEDPLTTRARSECAPLTRKIPTPAIFTDWKTWGAATVDGKPRLLVDVGSIADSVLVPGTATYLTYNSARSEGAGSTMQISLTDSNPDEKMRLVHLQMDVAGRRFKDTVSARANLTYTFTWDRQNVYKQTENGLVNVNVKIGYEFVDCSRPSEIVWVERRARLAGKSVRGSTFGGWTLDIHHHYDIVNNVLERGDGSAHFLGEQHPVVELMVGKDKKRAIECEKCDSSLSSASLFRPSALAVCPDGSTLIGDHNLIRRLTPDGRLITILILALPDTTHPYYMAVNPLSGEVFISLPLHKQIWKITNLEPLDPNSNHEIFAGDGTTCASASDPCGDGGPASDAQLFFPKGMAVDTQGTLYVADGRRVRSVSSGTIRSVADQSFDKPPSGCRRKEAKVMPIDDIQLEWPSSLSVDWHTDSLYVLDSNVVYEMKPYQDTARVLLGTPSTCSNSSSSLSLRHARDVSASPDGKIYILESDGKKLNQIRVYSPDSNTLSLLAGRVSPCSCDVSQCGCDSDSRVPARSALFNSPQAISVDARGRVLVADSGNAKVKRVSGPRASFDSTTRQYVVQWPAHDEMYFFNRHGLHIATKSLLTDRILYNFSYNVDTHLGRLSQISSPGGLLLRAIRTNDTNVSLDSPAGLRTALLFSPFDGTLETITMPSKDSVRLYYQTGGLLKSDARTSDTVVFGYNSDGRATSIAQNNHLYSIGNVSLSSDTSSISLMLDSAPFAIFHSRENEWSMEGADNARVIQIDDGFEVTNPDGSKVLFEAESHPLWPGASSISRRRTTLPSISNPSRREITSRFDWRPFVRRAKGPGRRVAEFNGVNVYAFEFDRTKNRDVVKNKNDDEMLSIEYTETGECKAFIPAKDLKIKAMNVSYDALGRRSEIVWGSLRRQFAYDRQNRITETNCGINERVHKFGYARDGRHPTIVDIPSGDRFTLKYDQKGGLTQITTPMGENHYFSSTVTPRGLVVKRRFPFAQKAFLSLVDSDGRSIEFVSADGMQWVKTDRDHIGRPTQISLNGVPTHLRYSGSTWRVSEVENSDMQRNVTWQGKVPVQINEARKAEDGSWISSSFSLTPDDSARVTSLQSVIEGIAVDSIQIKWNAKTGGLESTDGYAFLNSADTQRINGHKTMVESISDGYGLLSSRQVVAGDVRASLLVARDGLGRIVQAEWRRNGVDGKETRAYDVNGRVVDWSAPDGERWSLKYDKDGRLKAVNEVPIDYSPGGIPKKFGSVQYATDENGWTVKRGTTTFVMDPFGRLIRAKSSDVEIEMKYDEKGRLIWIRRGSVENSLFYALPHLPGKVTHFTDSKSATIGTLYYTESGDLFALSSAGYRYAILSDSSQTPRCVLAENGIIRQMDRTPTGALHSDSNKDFWLPVGYLGGVDIPEIGVTIINGRPLDHLIGRWMSFSPEHTIAPPLPNEIDHQIDVWRVYGVSGDNEVPSFPAELSDWLSLIGVKSSHLVPSSDVTVSLSSPAIALSLATIPSQLRLFTRLSSLAPSRLSDTTPSAPPPNPAREEPGFTQMVVIISESDRTRVECSPLMTAAEQKLLEDVLLPAKEVPWRVFSGSGWERHFVRSDSVPPSLTSLSTAHFTVIVSQDMVELRSANTKIIVYFGTNVAAVRSKIAEELRRKEGPRIWRAEKILIERTGSGRHQWTDSQKRELLQKGAVAGYIPEMTGHAVLPSVHLWTFQRSGKQ